MKSVTTTGMFLLTILLMSSFVTLIPAETVEEKEYSPSLKENKIWLDRKDVYLSVIPSTLTADGYIYVNITSKTFGGDIDFCLGVKDDLISPCSLEMYDPHNETTQHKLNLTTYWDKLGYNVVYNFTKKSGNIIYDGYVYVSFNQTILSSINQTSPVDRGNQSMAADIGNETSSRVLPRVVSQQHFDFADLDSKIFYWNTTEALYWRSIPETLNDSKQSVTALGLNTWYFGNISVQKGEQCYLRVWLAFAPDHNNAFDFLVGVKPSEQRLEQAVASGTFWYLTPWYNTVWERDSERSSSSWVPYNWLHRKSHIILNLTTAQSGYGTNYPVKVYVFYWAGTDFGDQVYLDGACKQDFGDIRFTGSDGVTLLDYWIDSSSIGSVATFWVKIAEDLSLANRTIYIYYGNPNAATTSNQFTTDVAQLREQKINPFYDPDLWFYGGSSAYLFSTTEGLGYGYAFFSVPKSWINGKYLRWCWQGTWDYTAYQFEWSVRIYDGVYNRAVASDFPVQDGPALKGSGLLQYYDRTANYSFGPETVEFLVNVNSAQNAYVTIFLFLRDAWIADWVVGIWDFVEVNSGSGGSGNIARADFTQSLGLIEWYGVGDYGLMRKYVSPEPSHGAWGVAEPTGDGFDYDNGPASVIYGTQWLFSNASDLEQNLNATSSIYNFFHDANAYGQVENYYGAMNKKLVLDKIEDSQQNHSYSAVFYIGHMGMQNLSAIGYPYTNEYAIHAQAPWYQQYDPDDHILNKTEPECIWDRDVYPYTDDWGSSKQRFVFLWVCNNANEPGSSSPTYHGPAYCWTPSGAKSKGIQ